MLDETDLPPGMNETVATAGAGSNAYRFPVTLLSKIKLPDEPEDLIRGLLPGRSFVVLYGRPGCGKSFIALDMALHVAAGRSWAGRKVKQAGVIYVAAEGGRGLNRRVIAALRHHRFESSLPFALVTVAPNLGQRDEDADTLVKDVGKQLPAGFDCRLVILDTLARTMTGGDESGSAGMGIFIENAEKLGRALGATVMPVHHLGKDVTAGMRGSSALLGAVDAAWEVDPEVEGLLKLTKMKDAEGGIRLTFSLDTFELGHFADGEPITSCVVTLGPMVTRPVATNVPAPNGAAASNSSDDLPANTAMFFDALRTLLQTSGHAASARYKSIPKGARVLRQADLRAHAAALGITGGTDKSCRTLMDRQVLALTRRGLVARHDGWIWLADNEMLTKVVEKHLAA